MSQSDRTTANIKRELSKQQRWKLFSRLFQGENKDRIAAWKLDLAIILQIFEVRPVSPVRHSQTQLLISDQVGDQYSYPRVGCGYPSKHGDGTGWHPRPIPTGMWFPIYKQKYVDHPVGSSQVHDTEHDGARGLTSWKISKIGRAHV